MDKCYPKVIRQLTENVTQRKPFRERFQALRGLPGSSAQTVSGRPEEATQHHSGRARQDDRLPSEARECPAVWEARAPAGPDPAAARPGAGKPPARGYTPEDERVVLRLAQIFDQISSQRLRVAMDATLPILRRQGHLRVSTKCYVHLQRISPATMDRIRSAHRLPGGRHRGFTKPGTLLKRQIPIRTFANWDATRPGFVEVDLVDHSGGDSRGEFGQTLNATDVHTGWTLVPGSQGTEMAAVPTKAQKYVFAALQAIRGRLPVPLLGLDSDNGAEFINHELFRYCLQEQITFSRGRERRKNDNPFVEQPALAQAGEELVSGASHRWLPAI